MLFFAPAALCWGNRWGTKPGPMRYWLSIDGLATAHGGILIPPKPLLTLCRTQLFHSIHYSVSPPSTGGVTSTSIGAARTRANTLSRQRICAEPQLRRIG